MCVRMIKIYGISDVRSLLKYTNWKIFLILSIVRTGSELVLILKVYKSEQESRFT